MSKGSPASRPVRPAPVAAACRTAGHEARVTATVVAPGFAVTVWVAVGGAAVGRVGHVDRAGEATEAVGRLVLPQHGVDVVQQRGGGGAGVLRLAGPPASVTPVTRWRVGREVTSVPPCGGAGGGCGPARIVSVNNRAGEPPCRPRRPPAPPRPHSTGHRTAADRRIAGVFPWDRRHRSYDVRDLRVPIPRTALGRLGGAGSWRRRNTRGGRTVDLTGVVENLFPSRK